VPEAGGDQSFPGRSAHRIVHLEGAPKLLRTPLCDLLGIDVPIIGAPFGPWHQVELAAAVCAAGGLGSVGSVPRPAAELREQWEMLRRLTDRTFAINHTGPFDPEVFEAVLDFGPPVVSCHLADPAGLIERAHAVGALWMQQVVSVEQARRAIDLGADVIIAQGGEADGHGGGVATTMLVPQVVDAAGVVPVVAAGGIADGRGLVAALAMGAQGVSMEMLRTPFLEHWAGRADELGCRAGELGAEMVAAIMAGHARQDVPAAGQPTGRSGDVLPVGEIVRRSLAQAEDALARLQTYRAVRCGFADSSAGRHT
jgi:enoyl-[acyl-carrier protein] reductase II